MLFTFSSQTDVVSLTKCNMQKHAKYSELFSYFLGQNIFLSFRDCSIDESFS